MDPFCEATRVILRTYVGGALVTERLWRLTDGADQARRWVREMARITNQADDNAAPFCVELENLDGPPTRRFARWGTDPTRMTDPVLLNDLWFDGMLPDPSAPSLDLMAKTRTAAMN